MADIIAGTEGDNSGILIDVYKFIDQMQKEILDEESHPLLDTMYHELLYYYADFIELSETTMKERFDRIIDEQRF